MPTFPIKFFLLVGSICYLSSSSLSFAMTEEMYEEAKSKMQHHVRNVDKSLKRECGPQPRIGVVHAYYCNEKETKKSIPLGWFLQQEYDDLMKTPGFLMFKQYLPWTEWEEKPKS